MTTRKRNQFLDLDSEDDDRLSGFDSGAAEDVEFSRTSKRRKTYAKSTSSDDSESESEAESSSDSALIPSQQQQSADHPDSGTSPLEPALSPPTLALTADEPADEPTSAPSATNEPNPTSNLPPHPSPPPPTTKPTIRPPGVIYLSRIPPFMRPSTVRSLLSHHGAITRLFLTPEPPSSYLGRRARGGNKKKSYIDGWVEFASRRDARVCAAAINAQTIGRKAGFYGNDVWNARYLKGFSWTDLMAGARAEEREREERVRIGLGRERRERKAFLSAVEMGRREVAKREKREKKKAEKMNNSSADDDRAESADKIQGGNTTPSTTTTTTNGIQPPSSSSNLNSTSTSKSKSKSKPAPNLRPELRFRQHALAPTAARTRTRPSTTRTGNGDGKGDKGDGDAMVTRVLRQIF